MTAVHIARSAIRIAARSVDPGFGLGLYLFHAVGSGWRYALPRAPGR